MVIGAILKYKKLIKDEFYNGASRFVFLIATPALLFMDTASVNFEETFNPKFVGFILGIVLLFVILLYFIYQNIVKLQKM